MHGRVLGGRGVLLAWIGVLPLLAGCAVAQWWLDRWSLGLAFDAYLGVQRILANAALGWVVFLLLAALTRRLLLPLLLSAGLLALFYAGSALKYKLLGMPAMLQDLYFLTSLDAASVHLFSRYLQDDWRLVAALAGACLLLAGVFWLEPCWCRRFAWRRLATAAVSMVLLVCLRFAAWPWHGSSWYAPSAIRASPLSALPAALHGGVMASLLYYHDQRRHRQFEVDAAALRAAFAQLPQDPATPQAMPQSRQRPDVVVVLSESFMDPRVLNGMQNLPDLIPNMRAALQAGHGGMMLAPTFGGGTVRTEFEVLTGMPVAAFPGIYYPYVDLNVAQMPGLVSALEKQGYASVAIHGNAGSFWNRTSTYRAMGVDRFITQSEMFQAGAQRDGDWLSDRSMTDILLSELAAATQPAVVVAISIESHGPYAHQAALQDLAEWQAIQIPAGLDAKAAAELRTYFYHLRHADQALGRLLAGLRARQRPFVLLFFGDHLPAFDGVYAQLGFVNGQAAQQQQVPWLLASNVPGMTVPAEAQAWELPALLMHAAGNADGGWFGFVRQLGAQLRLSKDAAMSEKLTNGLHAGANARLQGQFETFRKQEAR